MQLISGIAPLSQADPSFFIAMCQAIGQGIGDNSTALTFSTNDSGSAGLPPVGGSGTGTGIVVNKDYFTEDLYTKIRQKVIDNFGETKHEPFPPSSGNSGEFLLAVAEAIAEAVTEHYATAWTLTSTHPDIYSGTGIVPEGAISGLEAPTISASIVSLGSTLQGPFWPVMAQQIADSYVDAIHNHSTATVSIEGVCVPSISPLQVCGLVGSTGSGSGGAS